MLPPSPIRCLPDARICQCPTPDRPRPPAPAGSLVALGEPVMVADVVLTPMRVTEDSRCPINARCISAGQIIVETLVDGAGWHETVPMTLGEHAGVHGYVLNLVSAEPGRMAGAAETKPLDYRFDHEGNSPGRPLHQASVSAATPGSSRPSIHSRNAPPAVET